MQTEVSEELILSVEIQSELGGIGSLILSLPPTTEAPRQDLEPREGQGPSARAEQGNLLNLGAWDSHAFAASFGVHSPSFQPVFGGLGKGSQKFSHPPGP